MPIAHAYAVLALVIAPLVPLSAADRQLLWGDTHLHTSYSFDAFLNGNHSADPDTAYRFARGLPVIHPFNRTRVRLRTPLDFLVVADHAEAYGTIGDIYFDGIQDPDPGIVRELIYWYYERQIRAAIDSGDGPAYFASQLPTAQDPIEAARTWAERTTARNAPGAEISATNAWARTRAAAERHNTPGTFTALLGWEWSSLPGGANLHRVVMTDADGDTAGQFLPLSSTDSPYPTDLWDWLEATSRRLGARFIAIPHNSNISKGLMFAERTLADAPIDADYARTRRRWEPVVEVTQIKGDSETHPDLSPGDDFADFELYPWWLQQDRDPNYVVRPGDYVRAGLRIGLALQARIGVNPYAFGLIGSTDSHTGLASAEEPNFWGKMAYDSIPENKQGRTMADGPTGWTMQAGGLAAVWAEANTRAAIFDAFVRREVYATTGPRIRLRFFGGFDFTAEDLQAEDLADPGYGRGVPMGGSMTPREDDAAPSFLVTAAKDPESANLDRIQIVKGWVDDAGRTNERVVDVAWSSGRAPGPDGRVPPVGDTVDRRTATWTDTIGATRLEAHWADPDFDPAQPAFYYVRVLEIPTPRHALYDALALGLEAPTEGPAVIQERAYSSPVYYCSGGC